MSDKARNESDETSTPREDRDHESATKLDGHHSADGSSRATTYMGLAADAKREPSAKEAKSSSSTPQGVPRSKRDPLFNDWLKDLRGRSIKWADSRRLDRDDHLRHVRYLNACAADLKAEELRMFAIASSIMARSQRSLVFAFRTISAVLIVVASFFASALGSDLGGYYLPFLDIKYIVVFVLIGIGFFPFVRDHSVDNEGRKQTEWERTATFLHNEFEKKCRVSGVPE